MTRAPEHFPVSWPPPNGGWLNGSPWWVKVGVYFGFPTAIAIFLLWFVTQQITSAQATMLQKIDAQGRKLDDHISTSQFYLRGICLNVATTEAQRANCELPR